MRPQGRRRSRKTNLIIISLQSIQAAVRPRKDGGRARAASAALTAAGSKATVVGDDLEGRGAAAAAAAGAAAVSSGELINCANSIWGAEAAV